jgi:hypothetical protein
MASFAGINSSILGIGTPQRHASYILGRQPVIENTVRDGLSVVSGSIGANAGNSYADWGDESE